MAELDHLNEEDRALVRRMMDLGERAMDTQDPVYGDFLDPDQRETVRRELAVIPGLRILFYGGYRGAERQRLVLAPDFLLVEGIEPHLGFIEIKPSATAGLEHRDYLGSILGLGLSRGKIGDILVLASACQAVVDEGISQFILDNLASVGRARASASAIEPEQLEVPPERIKEIRTTVASPRLDAVAADGFGESRTRMAREIKAGRVRVNWRLVQNPDKLVEEGDIISIRGRGRVIVAAMGGRTKKGRLGLVLRRLM